jgi:DNA-binding response OmpR family regulator
MRVLVIEDDRRMAALLEQGLREEGNQVLVCHDGKEGLGLAETPDFDVVVLDVMLPGLDGFEIARRLRRCGKQTPILMLTARDAPLDIVKALDLGADDYLTKPFVFDVFLARVRAAARRGPATQPVILRAGGLSVDTSTREVRLNSRHITLTRTEYSILELLLRRRNRIVTRDAVVEEVWGAERDVESNTLDAFMKLLRSKVDLDPDRKLIQTVRGVGYILRTDME